MNLFTQMNILLSELSRKFIESYHHLWGAFFVPPRLLLTCATFCQPYMYAEVCVHDDGTSIQLKEKLARNFENAILGYTRNAGNA